MSEAIEGSLNAARALKDLGLEASSRNPIRRILVRILWPILRRQVEFNNRSIELFNAVASWEHRLDRVDSDLAHHSSVLSRHEIPLARHEADLESVRAIDQRLDLMRRQLLSRYREGIGQMAADVAAALEELDRLHAVVDGVSNELESVRLHQGELGTYFEDRKSGDADVRMRLAELDQFLTTVKRALPEPPTPEALAAVPSGFETLYTSFEEALRGSEKVIRDRARSYLDDLADIPLDVPVVDLGCGRGEWLELLAEKGLPAYGVDTNASYVEAGRAKGLDVREGDARSHLSGVAPRSLGAVTALHIVEHLHVDAVIELLDLAARALHPGGVLIVETPNPDNVFVGSSSFYLDPTHVRPMPPLLLSYLVGARGFSDIEVRPLKRAPRLHVDIGDGPWSTDVAELWDYIETRIAGAEDYAVIARRR
jgi:SAM-dependent methyltransferase